MVNAPVFAVVAPTVPLILIEAVPVKFVTVPEDGVPKAPPFVTNAPAEPTATPKAVTTPVPVVIVLGATPVPPPIISALAVNAADDAHVDADEKYVIPPEVPATVRAGVDVGVPTDINPPVNETFVTVPVPTPPTGDTDIHVVPLDVNTLPDVPGATKPILIDFDVELPVTYTPLLPENPRVSVCDVANIRVELALIVAKEFVFVMYANDPVGVE